MLSLQKKCDVCSLNNKLCLKKNDLEKILEKYKHMKDWEWKKHKGNQQFFNFRKEFVDALLENIIIDLNCQYNCKAESVGSNTLFSDYDLTVTGPLSAEIVDIFNKEFRRIFGKESAIVFDTNVYGASFMEELNLGNFSVFVSKQKGKIFKYVANAGDEQSQRNWALLKLYKSLKGEEIEKFKKHFKEIPVKYRELYIKNDIKKRNREYVKSLYDVACLKKAMKASIENDEELKSKYKNAISKANFYGSETYFTQGAFMHVVGERQSKIKNIPITHQEYIDSFIENIAETLKGLKYDGELTYITIEYVSKYLSRAMDALIKIINMHEDTNDDEKIKAIEKMYSISELIRTQVRGKKGQRFLKAQYSKKFIKTAGVKTYANLRKKLLRIFYHVVNSHNKITENQKGGGKRGREEIIFLRKQEMWRHQMQ